MGDKCAWFHVFCAAVYGGMALWVQYEYFFNPGTVFAGWLSGKRISTFAQIIERLLR